MSLIEDLDKEGKASTVFPRPYIAAKFILGKLNTFAPRFVSSDSKFGMACNTCYGMHARIQRSYGLTRIAVNRP